MLNVTEKSNVLLQSTNYNNDFSREQLKVLVLANLLLSTHKTVVATTQPRLVWCRVLNEKLRMVGQGVGTFHLLDSQLLKHLDRLT